MAPQKLVFFFGNGKADGDGKQKELLGGKGANLHEMTNLGLPVPPGFTISTEVCTHYYANGRKYPAELETQVRDSVKKLETTMGLHFGDPERPLLVSVRSGARASMPGMMDTILNLGLNEKIAEGMIRSATKGLGDKERAATERFVYDSYRRFITMYSDVVLEVDKQKFEHALEKRKESKGVHLDTDLNAEDWKVLVKEYKEIVRKNIGKEFPEDPMEQLWGAVSAVFNSWMNPRAITYRKLNDIPQEWGTAVNVQAMVFGNMGTDCATGVAFTRDPSTGEKKFFGEFLVNAQGEDVVAGIRTPQPINDASKNEANRTLPTLEQLMPKAYQELVAIYNKLEKHYRDMQDIEFTIQQSKLFMLQTRSAKRTAAAALRVAVEMVHEGLIDKKEAVLRVKPEQLDQLLHPTLDPKAKKEQLGRGLPASPGAATGQIVFDPETAETWVKDKNRKVILVRTETSPEDIHGMVVAQGILTARGGMTSHAAVVARGMGKCCVAGCSALSINDANKECRIGNQTLREGDYITLDGSTGEVIRGQVATIAPTMNQNLQELMTWVDTFRKLKVRANADTPNDARVAVQFGAEGIGLTRTEHMFFDPERIAAVREMILSSDKAGREKALAKIMPMQKGDFIGIFKEMGSRPVTIRLLDPPLHEFIPHGDEELRDLSKTMGVSFDDLKRKRESLHEFNPMLGHRGCRLGVSFPEIFIMQVRAIMEAAAELNKKEKTDIQPEIMIPLVADWRELKMIRDYSEKECKAVQERYGVQVKYTIGTMIELPRAALTADEIAQYAEFFSFGTNDLTQTTYGISRDDGGKFLPDYVENKIFEKDPFVALDQIGVGKLMKMARDLGRQTRPTIKLGICGEHGGEPSSVEFCHRIGLDYVSCSPYRVPIARLAAAHAVLKEKK